MTNSILHFQSISVAEIPILRELAIKIFSETYKNLLSEQQIEYMLEMMYSEATLKNNFEEDCHFFLLKFENENIGYGAISIENEIVTIHKIYVDGRFQGKGFGKEFILFLEKQGSEMKGKTIQLYVKRDNPAKVFYEKMGYFSIKEVDKNIGNGYWMNDFLMEKAISR